MNLFRKMKKRNLYFWTIMLSIALLCAQGMKLHVHDLDHGHDQQHNHISAEGTAEHSHLSAAHLSSDISHSDHHEEIASEVYVSQDGLLIKIFNNIFLIAILASAFIVFLPAFYRYTLHRRRENGTNIPWRYHISPPLRAPPL
jgi:hypothetical protein